MIDKKLDTKRINNQFIKKEIQQLVDMKYKKFQEVEYLPMLLKPKIFILKNKKLHASK